jgi:glycosyltransferase involved in cell wall biosynthesis
LYILGNGPDYNAIKAHIEDAKLSDQIFLCGNVENVQEYLDKATLYVHAAKYEPFGLVQIEAMAAGLPVIALDGKGNRELICDHINGFMVKSVDPILFAQKIIEIVSSQNKYNEFSTGALKFAKKFDIIKYVDQLIDVYKK